VASPAGPAAYRQLRFAPPPGATQLLLVRHGESEAAVDGSPFERRDGHGDPPLSEVGRRQAARVCGRLASAGISAVYTTTLQRTHQTAEPLLQALGLSALVEADLREVFLGAWEGGLYRKKVLEGDPVAVEMAAQERFDVIPGAEPAEAFAARVGAAVARLAAAHPDQHVAVFTHAGTIGQVLAQATGSRPFAFVGADNASISQLVVAGDRWILRRFNDTAHLEAVSEMTSEPLT
jgi:probable phosphoglycerate mutase